MTVSCWEDHAEYGPPDDGSGWPSVKRSTCLLPDGHDGPHKFTPDSEIVVRFIRVDPT
jgi:hypothetical protein